MRLVLCSRNPYKLEELRAALPDWSIVPLDADDYPPETGETYYENARAKALHGRRAAPADVWVVGEDSGIELDAFGGEPGVHSARWAAEGRQDLALLERLAGVADRRARMITHAVAISPDGREVDTVGVLDGEIAPEARGTDGFGYDPVFVPEGETRTVAELGDGWKRGHSHRALAAAALRAAICAS
ncbi:MAG TPA: non-canonical purine NTP pyrophosphatase [Gaiellaceae bacterium]|nr:non-canonical purine NTP pyrophosphatase [Gaiellaceae bacterium]